ncbi:uncharacterized protein [Epargyreus clarus]|uniref:uncharacterized protein n=1 Tax=Epargyreus clarus TaxID=520877 RepID=UPI003C2C6B7C
MRRKPCFWTRKLELELVEFVRNREYIWKPIGNTNHHIQQKYKAYAEFAAKSGRGITARSVRDRWVNIRSTFNHNLRRVDRSKQTACSPADVFVPCWPLWKPLQFLRDGYFRRENVNGYEGTSMEPDLQATNNMDVKEEFQSDIDDLGLLKIRQRGQRTDRPRHRIKERIDKVEKSDKCKRVLDDLLIAMAPLGVDVEDQQYWFFGKHVTERLNAMRDVDAKCASREILNILSCTEDNIKEEVDD